MSRKRRRPRKGCSIEARTGRLRLRFRWRTTSGETKQCAYSTALADTPQNRAELSKLADIVAALIRADKDPIEFLNDQARTTETTGGSPTEVLGPTVAGYFDTWIADKVPPNVRKAQARDYNRHIRRYVLPKLGHLPLKELKARDILGLKAELLQRGLSSKYVKNIVKGSLKAMVRDAVNIDEVMLADPFHRLPRWERLTMPGPEPFTPEERQRIIAWFRDQRFSFNAGRATEGPRYRTHPHFFAFVHLGFWSGMRPSELAGLRWEDVDLGSGVLRIRRSRHLYEDSAPKTGQAARTVELLPETVRILAAIQPLRVTPDVGFQQYWTPGCSEAFPPRGPITDAGLHCLRPPLDVQPDDLTGRCVIIRRVAV